MALVANLGHELGSFEGVNHHERCGVMEPGIVSI